MDHRTLSSTVSSNVKDVMSTAKVFSLEGKGLRLDTAADIEPHIEALRDNDSVEEIRLGGNTLGIEACEALAKVLETKKTLQVQPILVQSRAENSAPLHCRITVANLNGSPDRRLSRHIYIPPSQ